MPRSPDIASTGSPGIMRISENTSSVIPMKVGTTTARRLKRNVSMGASKRDDFRGKTLRLDDVEHGADLADGDAFHQAEVIEAGTTRDQAHACIPERAQFVEAVRIV